MNLPQRSLAGGEISPSLYPRVDLQKYATALRTLRNFQVMRSGGVETRPGTAFVIRTKYSSQRSRLIPFIINSDNRFLIELGSNYLRVHNAGTRNVVTHTAKSVVSATQANPCVFTVTSHGYSNGDVVYLTWAAATLPVFPQFAVRDATANTFTLEYIDGPNAGTKFDSSALNTSGIVAFVQKLVEFSISLSPPENDIFNVQFTSMGNRLILCDGTNPQKELTYNLSTTTFSLGNLVLFPGISAPTNPTSSGTTGTGTKVISWVITSIDGETYEESLPSAQVDTQPTHTLISWDAVTGAAQYNVYQYQTAGYFALAAIVSTNEWTIEHAIQANTAETPPVARDPFTASGARPIAVNYADQRLIFGGTTNNPNTCYLSRIGFHKNFTVRYPMHDDDAVTFTIADPGLQGIRHILDLNRLVLMTASGEWVAEGDANGVITPTAINLRRQSYFGSSFVSPIMIGNEAVFVQPEGSVLRNLIVSDSVQGLASNDLTVFSTHLFAGKEVKQLAYQKTPHSIVWAVRNDGTLLGMTYIREHEIFGWHRHDTDGAFESICAIPSGTHNEIFMVVKREIDGSDARYIEVMSDRYFSSGLGDYESIETFNGMDSTKKCMDTLHLTSAGSMTLSSSGGWDYTDRITLTHSGYAFSIFTSSAILENAQIHITGPDGDLIRFENLEYVSANVITGTPHKTVPASMRGVALSGWKRALNTVSGLDHLEGKAVSVFADGYVLASPNNPEFDTVTVTDGAITLSTYHNEINVGLPFSCDIETLDIDQGAGQSLVDKKKLINRATLMVESSRGLWVGAEFPDDDGVSGMTELKVRDSESYEEAVSTVTDNVEVTFEGHWNSYGRIAIRQVDPLYLSIFSIIPHGSIAGGK